MSSRASILRTRTLSLMRFSLASPEHEVKATQGGVRVISQVLDLSISGKRPARITAVLLETQDLTPPLVP